MDLARRRMQSQLLTGSRHTRPEDVVGWLGAVQAQDYGGAKWAVALRTRACTEQDVESALDRGAILRTHVLRPTWHLVLPADIRWMLALTAPRVKQAIAYYLRKLELDDTTLRRSGDVLQSALTGGKHLTRAELGAALERAGIRIADNLRLMHILLFAELDAVICSGARRGKQFTYALLAERAPSARRLEREEAMGELAKRYFRSHGPASVHDFAWWSGLTVREAALAVRVATPELTPATIGGKTFWFGGAAPSRARRTVVHLLPNFDEYLVAYQDRDAVIDSSVGGVRRDMIIANSLVVVDGKVIGTWRRTLAKSAVTIETAVGARLDPPARRSLQAAGARYGDFLGLPLLWQKRRGLVN
jgi:hypothetical protein